MGFDFELILAVAFLVTGAFWVFDRVVYYPKRKEILDNMATEARDVLNKEAQQRLAETPKFVAEVKSYFVAHLWLSLFRFRLVLCYQR